jgi:hypothetical protein
MAFSFVGINAVAKAGKVDIGVSAKSSGVVNVTGFAMLS